jgi:thiol-disulfide isomerase/thioredoxin
MMTKKMEKSLLMGLVLLIGTFISVAYGDSLSTTNVNQLSGIISGERGRPTVVMLFSSGCPLCRNVWPRLLDFAKQVRDKNVAFLAFSTDKNKEKAADFVSNYSIPFNCYWVEPWSPGQLDASMKPMGIQIGKSFLIPLVAVLDSNGRVVAQWQGLRDISQVRSALESIHAL